MCDLCKAVENGEGQDIGASFILLTCKTCKIPMLVLKWHREKPTPLEQCEMQNIMAERFPQKKLRGYTRSIHGHFHDHIVEE